MSAKFTFDGLSTLVSTLSDAGQIAADGSRDTVRRTAYAFADQVRQETPIGATGNLRRGIGVREDRTTSTVVAYQVRNTAPHAHLIELGFMHRGRKHVEGKFLFARQAPRYRADMMRDLDDIVPAVLQRAVSR